MRPYKVKHTPTGLYFQPHKYRGSHLSKHGKIYQTATNGVFMNTGHKSFRIQCAKDSQIHKLTENILNWEEASWGYGQLTVDTQYSDWVKEEI